VAQPLVCACMRERGRGGGRRRVGEGEGAGGREGEREAGKERRHQSTWHSFSCVSALASAGPDSRNLGCNLPITPAATSPIAMPMRACSG
jgi:hypothetical protein